jgi:penicillin amidase
MNIHVWAAQGRMAEAVGPSWVEKDEEARLLGIWRHSQQVSEELPAEYQVLLQAYADGVNAQLAAHPDDQNPLFETLGMEPEVWTPAHSLAAWRRVGMFFGSVKLSKAADYYEFMDLVESDGMAAALEAFTDTNPGDPDAAVVQVEDVPDDVQDAIYDYAASMGYGADSGSSTADVPGAGFTSSHPTFFGHEAPKFSHAWAVGGEKTSTGSPVLISDPQVPVMFPNLMYELQVTGASFSVRGIGTPGAAGFLIAFNPDVAWGMTAAGADLVDLFRLEMTGPDTYVVDGEEHTLQSEEETILVKGGTPVTVTWRQSLWGPVVTDLVDAREGDGFAIKGAPFTESGRDTFIGMVKMMRAASLDELQVAVDDWRHPSANLIAAETGGDVFYTLLGAIPVRSTHSPLGGFIAQEGNSLAYDHQDTIPSIYKPWVRNPAAGYVYSGNHRVEDGWYPLPLGTSSWSKGDTTRSRRVGEVLAALADGATPAEIVRDTQLDCKNSSLRDMVRLVAEATTVRQRAGLSTSAANTLGALQTWAEEGGDMRTGTDGVFLADKFVITFRLQHTFPEIDALYGGAANGLNHFLKTHVAALQSDPEYTLDEDSLAYLSMVLGDAWDAAIAEEPDTARWTATYDASASVNKSLTWFANNFALGSDFDGGEIYDSPRLQCGDSQTIWSQGSQVYTQVVDLSDTDRSLSVMAIGNTEGVSDEWWDSQEMLWADGHFKSAPLSEGAIDALVSVEEELIYTP